MKVFLIRTKMIGSGNLYTYDVECLASKAPYSTCQLIRNSDYKNPRAHYSETFLTPEYGQMDLGWDKYELGNKLRKEGSLEEIKLLKARFEELKDTEFEPMTVGCYWASLPNNQLQSTEITINL